MNTTSTGAVKVSLTLPADVYEHLEELCRKEDRNKSRQISWMINQYVARKPSAPGMVKETVSYRDVRRDGNIIYPTWKEASGATSPANHKAEGENENEQG